MKEQSAKLVLFFSPQLFLDTLQSTLEFNPYETWSMAQWSLIKISLAVDRTPLLLWTWRSQRNPWPTSQLKHPHSHSSLFGFLSNQSFFLTTTCQFTAAVQFYSYSFYLFYSTANIVTKQLYRNLDVEPQWASQRQQWQGKSSWDEVRENIEKETDPCGISFVLKKCHFTLTYSCSLFIHYGRKSVILLNISSLYLSLLSLMLKVPIIRSWNLEIRWRFDIGL